MCVFVCIYVTSSFIFYGVLRRYTPLESVNVSRWPDSTIVETKNCRGQGGCALSRYPLLVIECLYFWFSMYKEEFCDVRILHSLRVLPAYCPRNEDSRLQELQKFIYLCTLRALWHELVEFLTSMLQKPIFWKILSNRKWGMCPFAIWLSPFSTAEGAAPLTLEQRGSEVQRTYPSKRRVPFLCPRRALLSTFRVSSIISECYCASFRASFGLSVKLPIFNS